MISKQEIMDHAKKYNLSANIIEKDYILNWLLLGIASSSVLKNKWIFKGGTCLKKCYFEEYRFSEDLDYTIVDASHINEKFLLSAFNDICEWVYEKSGIEVPAERLEFEEYENTRGLMSITGKIAYKGPMQRRSNYSTVKLDLNHDEIVVCDPVLNAIYHPYSDFNGEDIKIKTYCIEEILAEKLRALVERLRPRDLYDVIHIFMDKRWDPKKDILLTALKKKCEYKKVDMPTMLIIEALPTKEDVHSDWNDMLAHQIGGLKPSQYYWEKLPLVFDWLYG